MKRLSDVIALDRWCQGGCGLSTWRHRRGGTFLGVIHYADRRFTKPSAKRLLLLAAMRERHGDEGYLNTPEWTWLYLYTDSVRAQEMAASFGFRLPSSLFDRRRQTVRDLAAMRGIRLSKHEKVRSWLRG